MKALLCLLAASAPAFSQALPEPRPSRAVVISVERPPAHDEKFAAYAVVVFVEEGVATESTVYLTDSPNLPKPGQHCEFNFAPGFPSGYVGREFWSKERGKLTIASSYRCDAGK